MTDSEYDKEVERLNNLTTDCSFSDLLKWVGLQFFEKFLLDGPLPIYMSPSGGCVAYTID